MPIIANAKKALRQSKTRNARNSIVRATVRATVKKTTKEASATSLSKLFSAVDKAVKKRIIHKNKAARIKSQAAKHIAAPVVKSTKSKAAPKKKVAKKTTKKQ